MSNETEGKLNRQPRSQLVLADTLNLCLYGLLEVMKRIEWPECLDDNFLYMFNGQGLLYILTFFYSNTVIKAEKKFFLSVAYTLLFIYFYSSVYSSRSSWYFYAFMMKLYTAQFKVTVITRSTQEI